MVRLSDGPIVLGEAEDTLTSHGHAVVLVGRQRAWRRRLPSGPHESVGLELAPWQLEAVLGVSAGELAGAHHPLSELLPDAARLREQLLEAPPARRAAVLQTWALERSRRGREAPALIGPSFAALARGEGVREVVARTGLSHRHFGRIFQRWCGLLPHEVSQLARFRRAVLALSAGARDLVFVALDAGYADQAHLTRELRARAGLTPAQLRAAAPFEPGHLPSR